MKIEFENCKKAYCEEYESDEDYIDKGITWLKSIILI